MSRTIGANIRRLTFVIAIAFLMTSIGVAYWSLVAANDLNADPFNPRLIAAVRDRPWERSSTRPAACSPSR